MEINEILNTKDLKELLNITGNKLTRLTKQGLPFVSLGGGGERKVFLRDSLLQWLKSQEKLQRN